MESIEYKIKDKLGIHARPAGVLVNNAKNFDCGITMYSGEKHADCKGIFGIMALCVKCGDTIKMEFSGADENAAKQFFENFLENNL